jgi:hypothetical protein
MSADKSSGIARVAVSASDKAYADPPACVAAVPAERLAYPVPRIAIRQNSVVAALSGGVDSTCANGRHCFPFWVKQSFVNISPADIHDVRWRSVSLSQILCISREIIAAACFARRSSLGSELAGVRRAKD